MNKEVLIETIAHLHKFDEEYQGDKPYSIQDFTGYLNAHSGYQPTEMRRIEGVEEPHIQDMRISSNSDISILITLMFRYAKGYIKKALQESLIQTADEFAFLVTLMTFESLTKTELINKQVMEKTSGVEVIKRLSGQRLIKEYADEQDKRSVRVSITAKGKKEIVKILPRMGLVSKIVVGNLSETEISTLSYLLKKLDHFHNDIFLNKKNLELDELFNFQLHK